MRYIRLALTGLLLLFAVCPGTATAAVRTQTVEYKQGDTVLEGYLAYDDCFTGKRPGILVVHEWTGLGPYVKTRCEELAKIGYVAFGADIYGKGVRPATHEEAGKVAGMYTKDRALMRARVKAGLDELKNFGLVDTSHIAAIGYCFGGAAVLELARSGADIAGVVTFHGALANPNPSDAKDIKARVLVQHGADDPFVDRKQLDAFMDEMGKAKADWRVIVYGGAVHSFTVKDAGSDPSKGMAYNEGADRRSWQAMRDFFGEIFK